MTAKEPQHVHIDRGWHDGLLHCPWCNDDASYLHHGRVTVYSRREDEDTVTETAVSGSQVSVARTDGSGNPSSRRDGLAISFACELCCGKTELTIDQHKGMTFVRWRKPHKPDPTFANWFEPISN